MDINTWSKVVAAPSCAEASVIQATGCECIEVAEADGAVEKRRAQMETETNNIDPRCLRHGITAPGCTRSVSGSSGTTRQSERKERKERKERTF